MTSEGCHAIGAAKKRLAAANEQRLLAATMMDAAEAIEKSAKETAEAARRMQEQAKALCDSARTKSEQSETAKATAKTLLHKSEREVEAAEKYLNDIEERYEVVDLLDDSPQEESQRPKKKRKVVSSETTWMKIHNFFFPPSVNIKDQDNVFDNVASEGCQAIGAAKKRLAAAKEQHISAATTMDAAKVMMQSVTEIKEAGQHMEERAKTVSDSVRTMSEQSETSEDTAQTLLVKSEKEVEAAEQFLVDMEKRYEVVDLLCDSPDKENQKPKKKYKVLASIENAQSNDRTVDAAAQAAATGVEGADPTASSTANSDNENVIQVIVEGCGTQEVNGIYVRNGLSSGYARFERIGEWCGEEQIFTIHHRDCYWFIGLTGSRLPPTFYRTMSSSVEDLPPERGWMAVNKGISPAPILAL